jgi:DNA-binding transcriptional ArsR family regulator
MRSDGLDRAFAALADPTRRGVVDLLRRGPRRAGELAVELDVSAPALTRHLRVLRDSGLVEEAGDEDDGRVSIYHLRREAFVRLQQWIDDVHALWQTQLESFVKHVRARSTKAR